MNENLIVRAALEDLARQHNGAVTPQEVVEAARPETSPLHDYFEWNDNEAAQKYRLTQARGLLNRFRITYVVEERRISAPMFLRDPARKPDEQGYTTISRLKTDEDAAREAVIVEFIRAANALERARAVAIVLEHRDAISQIVAEIRALRDLVGVHNGTAGPV